MTSGEIYIKTRLDNGETLDSIEELYNRLVELKDKMADANGQDFDDLCDEFDKVGEKLQDAISQEEQFNQNIKNTEKSSKKIFSSITKWGLALIGIRQITSVVRDAFNRVVENNEQLKGTIESIKNTIASALQTVIERIVNWLAVIVSYANYLLTAWFGTTKQISKSAKGVKEMKKTMAGFDEMNTLQSGNGGGTSTPVVELPQVKENGILKWLADNGDIVLGVLGGIITYMVLTRTHLDKLLKLTGTQSGGIAFIISGIIILIEGVIKYLKEPTWENFIVILGGIALAVGGVALALGGIPALITAIILVVGALVLAVVKNWETIKTALANAWNWIDTKIFQPIANFFVGLWDKIKNGVSKVSEGIKNAFSSAWEGVKTATKTAINFLISALNTMINGINKIAYPIRALIVGIGKVMGKSFTMENIQIPTIPKLAVGGIVSSTKGVNIGGAIAGERGRSEGVIPLTDSQAMEQLGNAIGRYITINLTNNTQLDGKTISRQLARVQNERNMITNF